MRPRTLLLLAMAGAALLGPPPGAARAAPEAAGGMDLSRLAGRWYLIARLPAAPSRDFGAQVEYRLDGKTLVENYSAHADSLTGPLSQKQVLARPDPEQPGRWKIRTGWLGSDDRLLLYVSPAYRRAIVADGERKSAWVLAREPEVPEWTLAGLLARLQLQGYEVATLKRVVQKPEQVGQPGFE